MTYRDNLEAARMRRDDLARELAEVRAGLVDRNALLERERDLVAAIAEASSRVDHLRSRASLPLLQRLEIASPCRERWDEMDGDGRARHCRRCDKNVYDLSAMSTAEASALLASRDDLCVRFYRRADGTVMTSDCPDGARRRRRRRMVVAVAVAAAGLGAAVASFQFLTRDMGEIAPRHEQLVGKYARPEPVPERPPQLLMGAPLPSPPEPVMGKPPSRPEDD